MTTSQQNQAPQIDHTFGPVDLTITDATVRDYVGSTGDETWWTHQRSMSNVYGKPIAPPTILDREVGTRLAATRYSVSYALHAKQTFELMQPLFVGENYTIRGALSNIYDRNEIRYFTITAEVRDESNSVALKSEYTRAFEFPGARHPNRRKEPLDLQGYLESQSSSIAATLSRDNVVHGQPRRLSQDLMNLYSGPSANFHTNVSLAAMRGHPAPIAQGLMVTSIECAALRDLFGEAWYVNSLVSTRYIHPIPAGSIITPWIVLGDEEDGIRRCRSAGVTSSGVVVTLSEATVGYRRETSSKEERE